MRQQVTGSQILRLKANQLKRIICVLSEEPTQNLPDQTSFEERVLARFDAIDSRLERLESRQYDTKPIWERALQAIMNVGLEVGEIKTRVGVIEGKVGVIESKVDVIEGKVGVIESKVDVIDEKIELLEKEVGAMKITFRDELVDVRRTLSHKIRDRLDLILKYLNENREDIRDAESRIRELESKFA